MITAILLFNQKGEIVISRHYRDDVPRSAVESFGSKVIGSKETGSQPPVKLLNGSSFLYTRHANLYFVAVTRGNVNPALVFEFLYQWIRILKSYLGDNFTEEDVKNTMTLLYELLDETMDFGYPQNCAIGLLRMYINLGTVKTQDPAAQNSRLTSQITGIVDWRREGLRFRKNEVHIDVNESVNLLMSANGNILRNECAGQVIMKTQLSGMPECKFALNDKLNMEKEAQSGTQNPEDKKKRAVEIDDCTFHRCVRLGKFDTDRTITFIPPDGEFELMRYRVTDNINLPFRLIPAIQEESKSKMTINLKATATFGPTKSASNVVIKIPVPPNTAKHSIKVSAGRAKFEPDQKAIVWRLKKFIGGSECNFQADLDLMQTTRTKAWSRPPISVDFNVSMFTASGVYVRYLRVYDKSGYHPNRWVRYMTRAGEYQIRI
mmetsp:Transcript_13449/g.39155  ORF Transcript_13449/g.39155 Transcript_13449/m.39155 type:complete len:434 (-) Transcript_13449:462-1763(-)